MNSAELQRVKQANHVAPAVCLQLTGAISCVHDLIGSWQEYLPNSRVSLENPRFRGAAIVLLIIKKGNSLGFSSGTSSPPDRQQKEPLLASH
jgi:hypothetical protein